MLRNRSTITTNFAYAFFLGCMKVFRISSLPKPKIYQKMENHRLPKIMFSLYILFLYIFMCNIQQKYTKSNLIHDTFKVNDIGADHFPLFVSKFHFS